MLRPFQCWALIICRKNLPLVVWLYIKPGCFLSLSIKLSAEFSSYFCSIFLPSIMAVCVCIYWSWSAVWQIFSRNYSYVAIQTALKRNGPSFWRMINTSAYWQKRCNQMQNIPQVWNHRHRKDGIVSAAKKTTESFSWSFINQLPSFIGCWHVFFPTQQSQLY